MQESLQSMLVSKDSVRSGDCSSYVQKYRSPERRQVQEASPPPGQEGRCPGLEFCLESSQTRRFRKSGSSQPQWEGGSAVSRPLPGPLWLGGLLPEAERRLQTAPQSREAEEQLLRPAAPRSPEPPPVRSSPPAPDGRRPPSEAAGSSQPHRRAGVPARAEVWLEEPPRGAELPAEAGRQARWGGSPAPPGSRGAVEASGGTPGPLEQLAEGQQLHRSPGRTDGCPMAPDGRVPW